MTRAVFDTNVYLRALINRRSWCGRLIYGYPTDYRLIVSQAIVFEVFDVISRPEVQAKFPHLAELDYQALTALFDRADAVEPATIPRISRDPEDDKFLACAQAAEADYLVTEDKDLLVLQEYEGTRIVQPVVFLAILEAQRAKN